VIDYDIVPCDLLFQIDIQFILKKLNKLLKFLIGLGSPGLLDLDDLDALLGENELANLKVSFMIEKGR